MKKVVTLFFCMVSSFAGAMDQQQVPITPQITQAQRQADFNQIEQLRRARRLAEQQRHRAATTAGIYFAGPIPFPQDFNDDSDIDPDIDMEIEHSDS